MMAKSFLVLRVLPIEVHSLHSVRVDVI
jgi:hypothetical protein